MYKNNESNYYLRLAFKSGGSWTKSDFDSGLTTVSYAVSAAFDSANKLHVAYHGNVGGSSGLYYITRTSAGTVAMRTLIEANYGYNNSIFLDSAEKPHIAYFNDGGRTCAMPRTPRVRGLQRAWSRTDSRATSRRWY